MSIPPVISLLFAILFFFQTSSAKTRPDDNYLTIWGEPSSWEKNLKEYLSDSVNVSHRVSTADDGFQTAYTVLSPKGNKALGTAVLVHGFDRDGFYWIDSGFLRASALLDQGYRVILPDLMVRGRTRDLNFPLNDKGQWEPDERQRHWMNNVTGHQEAHYLLQLLKGESKEGRDLGPLILGGHSRGALVSNYLAYQMGIENSQAKKNSQPLSWDVRGLWSFNGFLIYTTAAVQFMLDSSKARPEALNSLESLMEMSPHLDKLRNRDIEKGADSEIKSAALVEEKLKPLQMSYMNSFEGIGETGFVGFVMHEFETEMQKHGRSRFNSRSIFSREQELTEAMMKGLRTVYKLSVTINGAATMSTRTIMIPDSVIGIYRLIQQNKLPGIQNVKITIGKRDQLIPPKLALASLQDQMEYIYIENTDHFGPNTETIQRMFRQDIIAPNCRTTFR